MDKIGRNVTVFFCFLVSFADSFKDEKPLDEAKEDKIKVLDEDDIALLKTYVHPHPLFI